MANNIFILPMDDRPCTYNFPKQLAEMSGAKVIIPPKESMGNLDKIADSKKIVSLLSSNLNQINGFVISTDTLAYGGLIPSRRVSGTFDEIAKNLLVFRDIKKTNANVPIYAFSTIQRISNNNENQEEKEYWKDYGELIYKYSCLLDEAWIVKEEDYDTYQNENILDPKTNNKEILDLRAKIPTEILIDYMNHRFRNFKINKFLLKLVKEGVIDFLVISADDSSQYGFNVIEKKILNKLLVKHPQLGNRIIVYPGADETASVLIARLINRFESFRPKLYPKYLKSPKDAFLTTMYEGIPLKDTFELQVKALGGTIATSEGQADVTVLFHTLEVQQDQYLNCIYKKESIKSSNELIEHNINLIKKEVDSSNVALVDVAYANGGDHNFMLKLAGSMDMKKLLTYSSWNTTGNSIGTAIAHSSIRLLSRRKRNKKLEELHYNFLFERFLDDWFYQGFERLKFIEAEGFPLSIKQLNSLKVTVENLGKKFLSQHNNTSTHDYTFESLDLNNVRFPWNRPFEVSLECNVKLKEI